MLGAEVASVSSEFHIFVHKPIQTTILGTFQTVYKPIVSVEKNDLVFVKPGD